MEGYVFGGLRSVNILFDEDKMLTLIGFDWAGLFGMTITDAGLSVELQKKIEGTVDSLVTHGSHTPYSLKFHTFLSPPSWFAGKSAS